MVSQVCVPTLERGNESQIGPKMLLIELLVQAEV